MNAPFKQAERLGQLTTALGKDVLALLRFDGTDHLNELFEYRVEALATREDLDFDALIGTTATVEIEAHDQMRPFAGIVTAARWAGVGENGHRYDLTLRPWFWLAGKRRNQRIFHNKTVVQILRELLSDYASLGEPALKIALDESDFPTLEYTVQYRESDLDFARRLMERFGISFHFTHDVGSHTMVLTTDLLTHDSVGARVFKRFDGHHHAKGEHFWEWAPERNLTTGAMKQTDYNFKTPNARMWAEAVGDAQHAEGQIESFDYPGGYEKLSLGEALTRMRTAQERGADRRNRAVGDCVSLGAGLRMTLTGDKIPGTGEGYLCLSASHHFVSEAYGSGSESDGYSFTGSYVLMPDTAPMLPPRRTAGAVVQGPQTAVVVGDGEIDCDEYGRILVRFHWDLDDAYSMRCRVSQNWAGNGWGGMVIPRIGMEVVVEFLEGDPDKPLVTGCVYNGKNAVPYALPANKTVSTFKSDTHQGAGYNEFRFEDEKGREEVFMHAQRDHNTIIENDESHSIGHDRSKSVGNDQSESIGHDKTISVGNDHTETIGNDMTYNVGRNQQENYGKDHLHRVGNIHKQAIYADHLYETGRNFEGEVFGRYTLDVGESITNNTKTHTLMAFQKMQIKGPGGKITIDASGIVLEAPTIQLKGNVVMGGSGGTQVPTLQMAAREGLPLCEECAKDAFDKK